MRWNVYREMTFVVVREMSEQVIWSNQLQNGVTKKLQRLIVTAVQQHTTTDVQHIPLSFLLCHDAIHHDVPRCYT